MFSGNCGIQTISYIMTQREDYVQSGLLVCSGMHVVVLELMIIMTFGDVVSPGIKGPACRVNITA